MLAPDQDIESRIYYPYSLLLTGRKIASNEMLSKVPPYVEEQTEASMPIAQAFCIFARSPY